MAAKVVKLVSIPAALGLASIRVYALSEEKKEELFSPEELSIYAPPAQQLRYVSEQPGLLQRGFGVVRVGLQPYVRAVKGACTAVKVGAVSIYHAGQDTYNFLRDPPPGFLPRVSVITVSGLAGLILARKGSRLKKLGVPLGLATVGTAVCYPSQTVGLLKVTGKKTYAATQWTTSSIASLWRPRPAKDAVAPAGTPEAVSVPVLEPEVAPAKPHPEAELTEPALPPVEEPVSLPPLEEAPPLAALEAEAASAPAPAEDLSPNLPLSLLLKLQLSLPLKLPIRLNLPLNQLQSLFLNIPPNLTLPLKLPLKLSPNISLNLSLNLPLYLNLPLNPPLNLPLKWSPSLIQHLLQ
ncbi:hypothetical protein ANANG_G00151740 [Anguilla anguilla]|uniref:MICOS complex subunit n=1 Tax=Anguilla anguilla TaxID=7936 RepID=A0A9D3M6U7_ANGAN|nr:hypothetical protein ANANG_G00151740 [Anguilla anguilla]